MTLASPQISRRMRRVCAHQLALNIKNNNTPVFYCSQSLQQAARVDFPESIDAEQKNMPLARIAKLACLVGNVFLLIVVIAKRERRRTARPLVKTPDHPAPL